MGRDPLPAADIEAWIGRHPGWQVDDAGQLRRAIECPSFPDAIKLVDAVAVEAENADHHPDIDIRWRTVTFALKTHSAGALTQLDLALAETIDGLVNAS